MAARKCGMRACARQLATVVTLDGDIDAEGERFIRPKFLRELLNAGLMHADVQTIAGAGLDAYTQEPWRYPA